MPWAWHTVKCAQFAVCQEAAHGELTILCRVSRALAHGELIIFAVCLKSWRTANSSRRRQVPVPPSSYFFTSCTSTNTRQSFLPCARNLAHGKLGLCRACSCRQRFAVCDPRRNLRRVPGGLRRVPGAHGEVSKSGSECCIRTTRFYASCSETPILDCPAGSPSRDTMYELFGA